MLSWCCRVAVVMLSQNHFLSPSRILRGRVWRACRAGTSGRRSRRRWSSCRRGRSQPPPRSRPSAAAAAHSGCPYLSWMFELMNKTLCKITRQSNTAYSCSPATGFAAIIKRKLSCPHPNFTFTERIPPITTFPWTVTAHVHMWTQERRRHFIEANITQ